MRTGNQIIDPSGIRIDQTFQVADFLALFRIVQIGKIFHRQCPVADPAITRKRKVHGRHFKFREKVVPYESFPVFINLPVDRRSETGSVHMLVPVLEFKGLLFLIKEIEIHGS